MTSFTKLALGLLLLGSPASLHAAELGRFRDALATAISQAQNYTPGEVDVISAFRRVDRELNVSRVLAEGRLRGGELGMLEASFDLQMTISSRRKDLIQLAFNHEYDQIRSDATRLLELALADEPLKRELIGIASTDKRFSRCLVAHSLLFERRLWNTEASELLAQLGSAADAQQMRSILSMVSTWGINSFHDEYLKILQADWSDEEIERFRKSDIEGSVPYHIAANAISHMGPDASDLLPALEARIEWFRERFPSNERSPVVLSRLDHASKVARGLIPSLVKEAMDGTGPLDVKTQYGPDWLQHRIVTLKGEVDAVQGLVAHETTPKQTPPPGAPVDTVAKIGGETPEPRGLPILQIMIAVIVFGGGVIYVLRRRSR